MNRVKSDRRIVDRVVPLCLYSVDNLDSFIAAWVVWDSYHGAVQCEAVEPGKAPKVDTLGRDVIILGPLYQKAILLDLADRAATVLWITTPNHITIAEEDNIKTVKGTSHSLAAIAWGNYHNVAAASDKKLPGLLEIMFARDFGKFHAIVTNKMRSA